MFAFYMKKEKKSAVYRKYVAFEFHNLSGKYSHI